MWAHPRPATLYSVHPPHARYLRNLRDSPIPRNAPNASNQRNALFSFFESFGGKSDAADPFSIVPKLTFSEMRQMRQISATFFFEPSGGKSDAADPFSMVPKLSSAFLDNPSRRHRPSGIFNCRNRVRRRTHRRIRRCTCRRIQRPWNITCGALGTQQCSNSNDAQT